MDAALSLEESRLLEEVGFSPPFQDEQLKAGRNNQVFRITDRDETSVILKRYFEHPGDNRNRLEHEWQFLQYANRLAEGFVPRPLVRSSENRAALIEWINGKPFDRSPTLEEVRAGIAFVQCLNPIDREFRGEDLPPAADACFTWASHRELLHRRMARLERIDHPDAKTFVREELAPAAMTILDSFLEGDKTVNLFEQRVVSPSDFGFHNALRRVGSAPCFLDFEYAGWDGIGKLVADFFLQPDHSVDLSHLPEFVTALQPGEIEEGLTEFQSWCPLLAVHGLKWTCILLNGFLPLERNRRKFAGSVENEGEQLENARRYFREVCQPRVADIC